ncbi:MAG: glutamate-1-semialdehyde 2,1-aminomutase [Chitinophagales bacterium]|nr:glutamate-1-semialdehyde 2,1-aminomutase [Chitinophagales bacterium]
MNTNKSKELFNEAQLHIPGGVNSPVRAFKQVGGTPIFMKRADGAYIFDEDGNQYIDYLNSWGPMILGHNHPKVVDAVQQQVKTAFSFGTPTTLEVELAKLIKDMVPNIDMVRMVNSGTEACMSAVRLARGFTGKSKIIKFEGHYHGHADMFLKKAGSGVATLNIKQEGGIPKAVTDDTIVVAFNNFEQLEQTVNGNKNELSAIIVEPVAGNMGCVPPKAGYLELMRRLCSENNIVLIFDEVMTGFRLAKGGAQERLNVWADLVTFGKVIGGGLPVGAFGGRKDMMSCIAPLGNVYQAGTLSGNPLAMTAGFATLSELNSNSSIYSELENKGNFLKKKMNEIFTAKRITQAINQIGSMISVHFCENAVTDFESASKGNNDTFKKFFHHMLDNGIYLPPSAFESWFLSAALSNENLNHTLLVCESFVS